MATTISKSRRMRRKYKKLAVAAATAAVMSSAMLHGVPLAKVQATPAGQEVVPGQEMTTGQEATPTANAAADPVQAVIDHAAIYGFNATGDKFSLLTKTDDSATVGVRSGGRSFKVDLKLQGDSWVVTTVRGIGDMTRPATFIPASFFPGGAVTPTPAPPAATGTVLFATANFDGWLWSEAKYPQDMAFAITLEDPRPGRVVTTIPDDVLAATDFSRQFIITAHLGTVEAQGYGIGITKVMQTGNNLTVTVRAKSPQPGETNAANKLDDYVTVDRAGLDFANAIQVTFVDQNGTTLAVQTINPG